MKNTTIYVLCTLFAIIANVFSQPLSLNNQDHLFALGGRSMVTVSTGIPYVGITEYAYGFSDRFSVGLVAGLTPNVEGYGLRVRAILSQPSESFRLYFRVPMFYYPQTKDLGGEPWVLTWPVVSAEWKINSGMRLSVGGGAVVASCFHSLMRKMGLRKGSKKIRLKLDNDEPNGFMGGVWNTVHAGIALPISHTIMFQTEASIVMSGLKIAGDDWVGGPPVILVTGLSYSF